MDLGEWLEGAMTAPEDHGSTSEPADVAARLGHVGEALADSAASTRGSGSNGAALPISLGNAVVQNLASCEGLAVAEAGTEPETTWEMFRGRALDAYVAHALMTGPVADPVGDLCSMWRAEERFGDLALLGRFAVDEARTADLAGLAASAGVFSNRTRWVPRTELGLGSTFAAALALRGRIDVIFGGPGTGMATVLVEVKSASLRDSHFAQLRHYVMLAALRHGRMPAAAALWSPVAGLVPIHVAGSATSAAERVANAAARLDALWSGAEPELTPGVHCRFCPARTGCERADEHPSEWEDGP